MLGSVFRNPARKEGETCQSFSRCNSTGRTGTPSYYRISKDIGVDHNAKTGYPKGMIAHIAGVSADGNTLVITEIWESQADQGAFMNDRLMPAMGPSDQPPTRTDWFKLLTHAEL